MSLENIHDKDINKIGTKAHQVQQKHPLPSSNIEDSTISAKPACKKIRAKKYFPKYYGNTDEEIEALSQLQVNRVRKNVLENFPDQHFEVKATDSKEDPSTKILCFCGSREAVCYARDKFVSNVTGLIHIWNSRHLLANENAIEIDVKFDAAKVDIKASDLGNGYQNTIWVSKIVHGSEFQVVLGSKAKKALAITGLGFKKVVKLECNVQDMYDIIDQAKNRKEKWICVRLCIDGNEDLSMMEIGRVVRRGGTIMPRYKNRTLDYRGQWKKRFNSYERQRKKNINMAQTPSQGHERKNSLILSTIPKKRKASSEWTDGRSRHLIDRTSPQSEMLVQAKGPSSTSSTQYASFSKKQNATKEMPSSKAGPNQKQAHSTLQNDNYRHYQSFTEKMKDVMEIEFPSVHKQSAKKSMWTAHKRIFGNECEENCLCTSKLDALTRDVVSDFVSKARKKQEDFRHDHLALPGFVQNFCPKFYSKVQSSFPNDSGTEILSKLVDMWQNVHKKSLRFGLSCSEECPCKDSWTSQFLPHLRDKNLKKIVRNDTTKAQPSRNGPKERLSSSVYCKPTQNPLGFYCVTENNGKSKTCKIISIAPDADKKFAVGATIESLQIDLKPKEKVNSHKILKQICENLKKNGGNPTVTLKIKKNPTNTRQYDCRKDWVRVAGGWAWNGSSNSGWDGGAVIVNRTTTDPIQLKRAPKHLPPTAIEKIRLAKIKCPVARGSNQVFSKGPNVLQNERHASTLPTKKIKPAPKILRSANDPCTGHRVQFADEKKTIHTFTVVPSASIVDMNETNETTSRQVRKKIFSSEKLEEFLLSRSVTNRDVIRKLKHHTFDLITLKESLKKISLNLKSMESEEGLSKEGKKKESHFYDMRKKTIKIFELAHIIIGGEQRGSTHFNTFHCVQNVTPGNYSLDEIPDLMQDIENQRNILVGKDRKLLYDIKNWITLFQNEKDPFTGKKQDLGMDFNIDSNGVSLLHVAILVGEEKFVESFVGGGSKLEGTHDVIGPMEFAKILKVEAMQRKNTVWVERYKKVIATLGKLLSQRAPGI